MSTSKKSKRREFLKGALLSGPALATFPISSLGQKPTKAITPADPPRLPLTVHLSAGLSDGFTQKLKNINPEIKVLSNLEGSELQSHLPEIDVWFGWINSKQLQAATKLQWVQCPSAGVESFPFDKMIEREILLTNAKGCYGPAIGDHTIGLLLTLTRKLVSQGHNMVRQQWSGERGMVEMKGKTMGIVGLGGIGSQIARRARALDMKVIAVDIMPKYKEQIGDICDEVRLVQDNNLLWLLRNSDVVVSAAPHTKISEGMFGSKEFEAMKDQAYFINVSRGKLVQTDALVQAIKTGKLAGVGLDVTNPEPLPANHELWGLSNVIITSHIAARSQFSGDRMQAVFVENVNRFIKGLPVLNQVDKIAGF